MLRHTFIHLPGIGARRERALWQQGILDWTDFLAAAENGLLQKRVSERNVPLVRRSLEAVACRDVDFFRTRIPSCETWRLYSEFADRAVFLDIETTGLSCYADEVTLIGAMANGSLALFINGINLDDFPSYIAQFPLLITFNGSQFDVPFLRVHFPKARLDQTQIDLRFVVRSLGHRGGLKVVERHFAITRDPAIQAVDGFEAVRLWHRYRCSDGAALMKLAIYNLTDVVNLAQLTEIVIRDKTSLVACPGQHAVAGSNVTQLGSEYLRTWLVDHFGHLWCPTVSTGGDIASAEHTYVSPSYPRLPMQGLPPPGG